MFDLPSAIIIVLLVSILLVLFSQGQQLARLNRTLHNPKPERHHAEPTTEPMSLPSTATFSDFDRFLAEDPSRKLLMKKEQAAAYRAWRKEHGLTWKA